MESNNSDVVKNKEEALVLECIEQLGKNGNADRQSILSMMSNTHHINHEKTSSVLDSLKSSSQIFTMELKGSMVYMSTQSSQPRGGEMRKASILLNKCIKGLNQANGSNGVSVESILSWMQSNNGPPTLTDASKLEKFLDSEVSGSKVKRNEAGLYSVPKKRGRPLGSPTSGRRGGRMSGSNAVKRGAEESGKRGAHFGKRKRMKKNNEDYEFYDSPGSTTVQPVPSSDEPLCDFCLKSASCNRQKMFEELLMCKDCNAKAHPTCMGYCEILARRASLGPWQCIDCKTCCRCLESGDPDDLLFCDACDKGYHMSCHDPLIKEKPINKWACKACIDDGVTPADLVSKEDVDKSEEVVAEKAASTAESKAPSTADSKAPSTTDSVFNEAPSTNGIQQSDVSVEPVQQQDASPTTPTSTSTNGNQSYPSPNVVLPEQPSHWTVQHVSHYIQQCGFTNEAVKFQEQEIDGKSLMLLLRQDVLCNMNLKLGPALKIYEKIKVLQKAPAARMS